MPVDASELTRDQLLSVLSDLGLSVSLSQLRRWADAWLIPAPRRVGLGRGRGTISYYPTIAVIQIAMLSFGLQERRSLDDVGWTMWAFGFPITPFVRELLRFEWKRDADQLKRRTRVLQNPRHQQRIAAEIRKRKHNELQGMLQTIRPESVPTVVAMLSELQAGTLEESAYTDDEWQRLQEATLSALFPDHPEFLDDPELPSIESMREGLARQSRDASLPQLLAKLRVTDDLTLCIVRNEFQALYSTLAADAGVRDAIMPRSDFRLYFAARLVNPAEVEKTARIPQLMEWRAPPPSPLDVMLRRANSNQTRGRDDAAKD